MIAIPTHDYRRSDYRVPPRPLAGLDALVNRGIGKFRRRNKVLESLKRDADEIVLQEREWVELSDAQLQKRLLEFREHFRRGGKSAEKILFPAQTGSTKRGFMSLCLCNSPLRSGNDDSLRRNAKSAGLSSAYILHHGSDTGMDAQGFAENPVQTGQHQ